MIKILKSNSVEAFEAHLNTYLLDGWITYADIKIIEGENNTTFYVPLFKEGEPSDVWKDHVSFGRYSQAHSILGSKLSE